MNNRNIDIRKDWELILKLIESDKKVLDIGCGEGDLIKKLKKNKNCDARGIEVNGELVRNAISTGLIVVQGDAEKDLNQYSDESFDYAILSQTLQAMYNPKKVLLEMLRISSKIIVSFPNFGHWKIRIKLLTSGKMPITKGLPFTWYETPNIHFFTLKDFQQMCSESNIYIEKSIGLTESGKQFIIDNKTMYANLLTHEAIFLLSMKNYEPIKIKSKKPISASSKTAAA